MLAVLFAAFACFVLFGCKSAEQKATDWMQRHPDKSAKFCDENFPVKISDDVPVTWDSSGYNQSLEDAYNMIGELIGAVDSVSQRNAELQKAMAIDTCQPLVAYIGYLEGELAGSKRECKELLKKAVANVKPVLKEVPYRDTRREAALEAEKNHLKKRLFVAESSRDEWKAKAEANAQYKLYFWLLIIFFVLVITRQLWAPPLLKLFTLKKFI